MVDPWNTFTKNIGIRVNDHMCDLDLSHKCMLVICHGELCFMIIIVHA